MRHQYSIAALACLIVLNFPINTQAQSDSTTAPAAVQKLSIVDCIGIALQSSRQIQNAQLDEKVADKQVREAWGEVYPQIDAVVSYTRNLTEANGFLPDPETGDLVLLQFQGDNIWNASVVLEQAIFQAEAFVGVGAASRYRELTVEQARGTTQDIVTTVRSEYYTALLASESLRLTRSSIRRVQRTRDGAIELQQAGLGNSYDVLRLDVELARLQPRLRRAENAHAAALRRLKVVMGTDVETSIALAGSLYTIDLDNVDANSLENQSLIRLAGVAADSLSELDQLVAIAHKNRSLLLQSQLDISLSEAQLKLARAALYPKLFGFASYTIAAQENGAPSFFGETADDRATNWQAGLRLDIPLLEGGARLARKSQRSLQLEQSRTRQLLAEQEVYNEIRTLLERLLEARDRVTSQKLAIQQASRGFDIASTEFRMGLNTQFNALDSEIALRETEFNYAEAIFEVLLAQARLDRAVGVVPLLDSNEVTP